MQLATDDGIELHVEEMGTGSPVIMLHGLLVGNMSTWYMTAAPEVARRHRVILFDLRGHGLSERAARGYDLARMTSDLESVVLRLTDQPVMLVGHSYGGLVALTFALRRPERVRKLALVEAPLPPSSLAELEAFLAADPAGMLDALPAHLRSAAGDGRRRGTRFADTIRFLARESSDAVLRELRCPLLAIYGTQSSCRSVGTRLARLVPGASLVELAGGHFLPLDAPRELTQELARFIDA